MAPEVAWWVVARLVSQLTTPDRAVVHVDGSGRSTVLSVAATAEGGTGLVVIELPDEAPTGERLGAACRLLSMTGTLAVVLPSGHGDDLAGQTVAAARAAGLVYLQHIVALDAPVSDDTIDVPAWAKPVGATAHVRVHRDVLIFTQPGISGGQR